MQRLTQTDSLHRHKLANVLSLDLSHTHRLLQLPGCKHHLTAPSEMPHKAKRTIAVAGPWDTQQGKYHLESHSPTRGDVRTCILCKLLAVTDEHVLHIVEELRMSSTWGRTDTRTTTVGCTSSASAASANRSLYLLALRTTRSWKAGLVWTLRGKSRGATVPHANHPC
jgi:hypothetical protein